MNLRKAAQQALKEMDDHMYRADTHEFYDAKESLRYAIEQAEQAEQAEQEPDGISWIKRDSGYFTAPTPRKPLTPDQVFAIADQHPVEGFDPEIMAFVRAIERAHGITGETK